MGNCTPLAPKISPGLKDFCKALSQFLEKKSQSRLERRVDIIEYGSESAKMYRRKKQLALGSDAEIYLVERTDIEQNHPQKVKVAKIFKRKPTQTQDMFIKKVQREIVIQSMLDHPNICRIFDQFQARKQVYIILEHLEGGDVFQDLQKGHRYSEARIASLMDQMLWAVAHIHSREIVHRDIKLENFMYMKKGKPHAKLVDFGSAQFLKEGKKLQYKISSPYYTAPDMLKGGYDTKIDIWSLGVCCFILHFGSPPFTGRTNTDIFRSILRAKRTLQNIDSWRGASDLFRDFILKMLEPNPARRPTALKLIEHPWLKERFPNPINSHSQVTTRLLRRLQKFEPIHKVHLAVLYNLYNQYISTSECEEQIAVFKLLDIERDAVVTDIELSNMLHRCLDITVEASKKEALRILSNIDLNLDREISFSEFVIATLSHNKILNPENIKLIFSAVDRECQGYILVDQMREILDPTGKFSHGIWDEIFQDFDKDKNGRVTLKEFRDEVNTFDKAARANIKTSPVTSRANSPQRERSSSRKIKPYKP